MQVLTVEGVKEAARKAYDEGRLMAQRPEPADRQCVYVGPDDCGCAIGVALSPETRTAVVSQENNAASIGLLEAEGHVKVDDALSALQDIQRSHDFWCKTPHERDPYKHAVARDGTREVFLKAIDHPSVLVSA